MSGGFSFWVVIGAALVGFVIGRVSAPSPAARSPGKARIDLTRMSLDAETERRVAELAAAGRTIDAIKVIREHLGIGLKEAKDLFEKHDWLRR